VRPKIEIVGLHFAQRPRHADEILILGQRTGGAEIRRHDCHRDASVLNDLGARLNQLAGGETRAEAKIRAHQNQRHQRHADHHFDQREGGAVAQASCPVN